MRAYLAWYLTTKESGESGDLLLAFWIFVSMLLLAASIYCLSKQWKAFRKAKRELKALEEE